MVLWHTATMRPVTGSGRRRCSPRPDDRRRVTVTPAQAQRTEQAHPSRGGAAKPRAWIPGSRVAEVAAPSRGDPIAREHVRRPDAPARSVVRQEGIRAQHRHRRSQGLGRRPSDHPAPVPEVVQVAPPGLAGHPSDHPAHPRPGRADRHHGRGRTVTPRIGGRRRAGRTDHHHGGQLRPTRGRQPRPRRRRQRARHVRGVERWAVQRQGHRPRRTGGRRSRHRRPVGGRDRARDRRDRGRGRRGLARRADSPTPRRR